MNNWLKNLKIKRKLNLMIGVALLALVILGFTANFFIKTTKVVNIMLIAQRDYMMDYHKSLEWFYQYRANLDSVSKLQSAIDNIKAANKKLALFSNVDSLMNADKNQKIITSVLSIYNIPRTSDAVLLVKRIRLFNYLGIPAIKESSDAAKSALTIAREIQKIFAGYQGSIYSVKLDQDYHYLVSVLSDMEKLEGIYKKKVEDISDFTIKSLRLSIILIVLLLGLLIFFLSKSISSMITKPVEMIRSNLARMALGDLSGIVVMSQKTKLASSPGLTGK